jgi:hypothetical protein
VKFRVQDEPTVTRLDLVRGQLTINGYAREQFEVIIGHCKEGIKVTTVLPEKL